MSDHMFGIIAYVVVLWNWESRMEGEPCASVGCGALIFSKAADATRAAQASLAHPACIKE